jgi:hypothetical protein
MSEKISYVGDTGGDAYLDVSFYIGTHDGQEYDFIRINVPGAWQTYLRMFKMSV